MQLVDIYRELDPAVLSNEAIEHLSEYEGGYDFVLHNMPRDIGWTQEVDQATVAFHLVDADGDILASFPVSGKTSKLDAMLAAEKAASSASVKVDIIVPRDAEEDDEPEASFSTGAAAGA